MAVNKVQFGNRVLLDLTLDDVDETKVLSGTIFHKPNGEQSTGTMQSQTNADVFNITMPAKSGADTTYTVGVDRKPSFIYLARYTNDTFTVVNKMYPIIYDKDITNVYSNRFVYRVKDSTTVEYLASGNNTVLSITYIGESYPSPWIIMINRGTATVYLKMIVVYETDSKPYT